MDMHLYKKQEDKKDEAQIRHKLRNADSLNFQSKLERIIFTRKLFIRQEINSSFKITHFAHTATIKLKFMKSIEFIQFLIRHTVASSGLLLLLKLFKTLSSV